jgi:hypothetical protein
MMLKDIHGTINAWDNQTDSDREFLQEPSTKEKSSSFGHIYHGSRCAPTTVSIVEQRENGDLAFHDFSKKLKSCICDLLRRNDQTGDLIAEANHSLPRPRECIVIGPEDQVSLITLKLCTLQ